MLCSIFFFVIICTKGQPYYCLYDKETSLWLYDVSGGWFGNISIGIGIDVILEIQDKQSIGSLQYLSSLNIGDTIWAQRFNETTVRLYSAASCSKTYCCGAPCSSACQTCIAGCGCCSYGCTSCCETDGGVVGIYNEYIDILFFGRNRTTCLVIENMTTPEPTTEPSSEPSLTSTINIVIESTSSSSLMIVETTNTSTTNQNISTRSIVKVGDEKTEIKNNKISYWVIIGIVFFMLSFISISFIIFNKVHRRKLLHSQRRQSRNSGIVVRRESVRSRSLSTNKESITNINHYDKIFLSPRSLYDSAPHLLPDAHPDLGIIGADGQIIRNNE